MLRSISVISLLLLCCIAKADLTYEINSYKDALSNNSTPVDTSSSAGLTPRTSDTWTKVLPHFTSATASDNLNYSYNNGGNVYITTFEMFKVVVDHKSTDKEENNGYLQVYVAYKKNSEAWVTYNSYLSYVNIGTLFFGVRDITVAGDYADGDVFQFRWNVYYEGIDKGFTYSNPIIFKTTVINTVTPTSAPTSTFTPTHTFTNTPVPNTPTATRTWYYVPTNTPAPPTNTPITPVPTNTPVPTATRTNTPSPTPIPGVLEMENKHIGETLVPGSTHIIYNEGDHLLSLDKGYFPVWSDVEFRTNPGSYSITKVEATWVLYTNGIIFSNGTDNLTIPSPIGGWYNFVTDIDTTPSTDTLLNGRTAYIRWYIDVTLSDDQKLSSSIDTVNIILEKGFGYPTPTPITPVPTKTNTPVVTPSWTATVPTPTVATPSPTPIPPTNTPVTPSPTGTQVPPTNTVPPTSTFTSIPTNTITPTFTFTHTPTNTPTYTQVPMPQPTNTPQSSGIITITSYNGATGAYADAVNSPEFLGYSNTFPVNMSTSGYMVDPQYDKYFDPPYYDTEHIHTDYIDFDNRFHIGVHFQFTIQNTGSVPWDWVVTQLWRSTSLNPDVFTQVFTAYNPLGNCPTCGSGVTGIPVGHTHYYDLQARLRYESTAAGNTQRFQFLVSNGISTQELFDSGKILFSSTVTPTPTTTYTPTATFTPTFTPIPTATRTPVPLAPLGLKLDNKLYFLVRKAQ